MRLVYNGWNNQAEVANEAAAVALLCTKGHPNIVQVVDLGHLSIVNYYIDMELCDFSLAELLKREDKGEGLRDWYLQWPIADLDDRIFFIIALMQEVANFIHKHDQVHRDIKPENGSTLCLQVLTVFHSPLFCTNWMVETRRFWSRHARHNDSITQHRPLPRHSMLRGSGTFDRRQIQ
jgi:hypothetical protein